VKQRGCLNRQVKIEDLQEEGVWIGRSREQQNELASTDEEFLQEHNGGS